MYAPHPPTFAYCTQSYTGNPTGSPGAAVIMGFSNTPSTPVALISTPLDFEGQLVEIVISAATATGLTATDTSAIVDILIDTAGGINWDTTNIFIEGLFAGFLAAQASTNPLNCSRRWSFPVVVPAGATIAARGQSIVASGSVTVEVSATVYGGINQPGLWWCGTKVDAIGLTRASSKGATFNLSGSISTYTAWTSIGSATTRRYGCLVPSSCPASNNVGGGSMQHEFGISSVRLGRTFNSLYSSNEFASDFYEDKRIFADIPEGVQLQARARANVANSSSNQVMIHGVY
jgi:hypothetical protein